MIAILSIYIGAHLTEKVIWTSATYYQYLKAYFPLGRIRREQVRNVPSFFCSRKQVRQVENMSTGEFEISDYISTLNSNKSSGIDSIDPFIIKQMSKPLVHLLTVIYSMNPWKQAKSQFNLNLHISHSSL